MASLSSWTLRINSRTTRQKGRHQPRGPRITTMTITPLLPSRNSPINSSALWPLQHRTTDLVTVADPTTSTDLEDVVSVTVLGTKSEIALIPTSASTATIVIESKAAKVIKTTGMVEKRSRGQGRKAVTGRTGWKMIGVDEGVDEDRMYPM